MNKNFKVINLDGPTAILLLLSVITFFLVAFVVIPIWLIQETWNYFVVYLFSAPEITYLQAILLWLAAAVAFFTVINNYLNLRIDTTRDATHEEELDEIMKHLATKDELTSEDSEKLNELTKKDDKE